MKTALLIGEIYGAFEMQRSDQMFRDCTPPNIMMDWSSLVDEPFHPIYNTFSLDGEYQLDIRKRSQGNVRYYFIDFDLSSWFENQDAPAMVTGEEGREQTVP
ncbi:hypothetical protein, partial [Klebsiella quasipneumoniae]|uniref:hypothetical protein n=1 Tax=Klebsiella quasipneumoniae TaxID=1463165 RepID=UPI003D36CFB4